MYLLIVVLVIVNMSIISVTIIFVFSRHSPISPYSSSSSFCRPDDHKPSFCFTHPPFHHHYLCHHQQLDQLPPPSPNHNPYQFTQSHQFHNHSHLYRSKHQYHPHHHLTLKNMERFTSAGQILIIFCHNIEWSIIRQIKARKSYVTDFVFKIWSF